MNKEINNENYIIRREKKSEYRAVENLTREAFWNVYCPGAKEHFILNRLRENADFIPELDYVMELNGKLIGQVVYVRAHVDCDDGRKLPVMTFGPICIANEYKRKGYGKLLLDYTMGKAKELGAGALLITGNIDFYGKSGFIPALNKGIRYTDDPKAEYLLVKELKNDFLKGITGEYKDPKGYFACLDYPEEFEKYESTFPPKEKRRLPGQLFTE